MTKIFSLIIYFIPFIVSGCQSRAELPQIEEESKSPNIQVVSIKSTNIKEGEEPFKATVTRINSDKNEVVAINTSGDAIKDVDYQLNVSSLTFNSGELSKEFTIEIINDQYREDNEDVIISIGSASVTFSIVDDDIKFESNNPPLFYFSADSGITLSDNVVASWTDSVKSTRMFRIAQDIAMPTFQQNALGSNLPALEFDGVDDMLTIQSETELNLDVFTQKTMTILIKTGDDVTARQTIYEQGGTVRGLNIFIFEGKIYFGGWDTMVDTDQVPAWEFISVNGQVEPNTVYTIAHVFNAEEGTIKGYVDGELIGTIDNANQLFQHDSESALGATRSNTRFETGGKTGDGEFFNGYIAEFIYWNEALDDETLSSANQYFTNRYK